MRMGGSVYACIVATGSLVCPLIGAAGSGPPMFPEPTIRVPAPVVMDAAGDLDGDTIGDLVIASESDQICVLLGSADSMPTLASCVSLPGEPGRLTSGDINGDMLPDLLVSVPDLDVAVILLGDGAGGFVEAEFSLPTGEGPLGVLLADIDGDLDLDFIVANESSNSVHIRLNNGNGVPNDGFLGLPIAGVSRVRSVAALDYDLDGDLDLAVCGLNTPAVHLYENTGPLAFSFAASLDAAQLQPSEVVAADLSGDGLPDLVVANGDQLEIGYFRNMGDGAFAGVTTRSFGNHDSGQLVAGDLDSDGHDDIVIGSGDADPIAIVYGAPGGIGEIVRKSPVDVAQGVAVGDFNGDGRADVATGNVRSETVSFMYGREGRGLLSRQVYTSTRSWARGIVDADLDGDQSPEVLISLGGDLHVFRALIAGPMVLLGPPADIEARALAAGDLNGDQTSDLVFLKSPLDDRVAWMLGNGDGTFGVESLRETGDEPLGLATADADGDGDLDFFVSNTRDNSISSFENLGGGLFGNEAAQFTVGFPRTLISADIDADTLPDLVTMTDSFVPGLGVHFGLGGGVFAGPIETPTAPNPGAGIAQGAVPLDLDGDGFMDIAFGTSAGLWVAINDGLGGYAAQLRIGDVTLVHGVDTADFDGDGRTDIVVVEHDRDRVVVYLRRSPGLSFERRAFQAVASPWVVLAVDVNRDLAPDIVVGGSGRSVAFLQNQLGAPCPADYAVPFQSLDISDVLAFLSLFAGQSPLADLAEPAGVYDYSDVFTFLAAFAGGCPE